MVVVVYVSMEAIIQIRTWHIAHLDLVLVCSIVLLPTEITTTPDTAVCPNKSYAFGIPQFVTIYTEKEEVQRHI